MYEYENLRRVTYADEEETAVFIPVCPKCAKFVKADKRIKYNSERGIDDTANATCKKCGRVVMLCEGIF